MATTPCHPDNSGRLPRGCGAGLRRSRSETDGERCNHPEPRPGRQDDTTGRGGLLLPYPTQPKKNIRTCWPGCLMSSGRGKGANQCVIWGSVFCDCGIRQSGTGSVISPGDKTQVRLEDRGVPRIPCVKIRLSRGDCGRVRDKQKVVDRPNMCQEKRKMEGFM